MKVIKDPLYGYIEIEDDFIFLIDSIHFQRLRGIIQTSYVSVYPSSLHNRFTHSLGVYQLGKLAFDSLIKNSNSMLNLSHNKIKQYRKLFLFACLCHDLGHSPFSHTGEVFYDKPKISEKLKKKVKDEKYNSDLLQEDQKGIVGQEHEIMSALLAIEVFGKFIKSSNYEFFARCIIGLQYHDSKVDDESLLKKACIELLNSKIIDVDKLDYIIRDSYMSGYNSITIDYVRLLAGIVINKGDYPICYKKSALSVIETVLTAHDMERRWIQAHPVILYESFLLKIIIKDVEKNFNTEFSLFSLEALKESGVKLNDLNVNLLTDSDILFLAKSLYHNTESCAIKEYLNRSLRRHPIWKTEAEYNKLFSFKKEQSFFEVLSSWEEKLTNGDYGVYSLNDTFLERLKDELLETKKNQSSFTGQSDIDTLKEKVDQLTKEEKALEDFKKDCESQGLEFDFIIITHKQFKSNIYKPAFRNLPIMFDNHTESPIVNLSELTTIPFDNFENDKFFYLYYRRNDKNLDIVNFSKLLRKTAIL